MTDEPKTPTGSPEPDHLLAGGMQNGLPDGGPRYKETPPDPAAVQVAEPFNAITAALFVLVVVFWIGRLWGRFSRYPFITCCLPILLAGGIGGTLYHAFRTERIYLLLDVIPISLLGAAGSVYLTIRLGRMFGRWRVLGVSIGLVVLYLFVNQVMFRTFRPSHPNLMLNLSYASLALILLIPIVVVLVRTRFRHVGWVVGATLSFAIAWFCRLVDNTPVVDLKMGTHWLWHVFGALTTFALTEYFYLIEGEGMTSPTEPPESTVGAHHHSWFTELFRSRSPR
jgi:hypothetical protein